MVYEVAEACRLLVTLILTGVLLNTTNQNTFLRGLDFLMVEETVGGNPHGLSPVAPKLELARWACEMVRPPAARQEFPAQFDVDFVSKYVTCLENGESQPTCEVTERISWRGRGSLYEAHERTRVLTVPGGKRPEWSSMPTGGGPAQKEIPPEQSVRALRTPTQRGSGAQWPRSQSCMGVKDAVAHAAARTPKARRRDAQPASTR